MTTQLDYPDRLEALGRSLASAVPLEPPAEFMAVVARRHRAIMLRNVGAVVALCLLIAAIAMVATRLKPAPVGAPASPSAGTLRNVAPDDIDDTPALDPTAPAPQPAPPADR